MRKIQKLIAVFAITAAALSAISCEFLNIPTTDGNGNKEENVPEIDNDEFVILFTNDFHSQIEPLSGNDRGGIKRIKALVDSVRKAEPVVLLADAGDLVQGTYYFSLLNGVVEMMVLDELGYDIRTLGNHEFDKKMVGLGDMLAMSSVPVVATNYDFSNTALDRFVQKSSIVKAGKLKIGFIGLNVRLHNLVDPIACEGVIWQDAINLADQEAEKLRNQGADMVIALSHLGYQYNDERVYYDRGIAMNTKHIDMIIGGHSHTCLQSADYVTNLEGEEVPIVQTGSQGRFLGYAKIKLGEDGSPSFSYRLIPVDNRLDNRIDQDFSEMINAYSATVKEKMDEVIGYCPQTLRRGLPESPLYNLTGDALIWMAKEFHGVDADVSIYNTGGIRSEIPAGKVTLGDIYAVYPFDNVLSLVTMTGKDLKTLFEYVASNEGMPVNAGVKLVIRDRQVKSVTIDGKEIADSDTYTVATVDYLVNLGRYGLENAITRNDAPEIIRDYFGEYFRYLASKDPEKNIRYKTDGRITVE